MSDSQIPDGTQASQVKALEAELKDALTSLQAERESKAEAVARIKAEAAAKLDVERKANMEAVARLSAER
ncbi:hypothetical protein TrST_g3150 [Triparma strigata]|uniref:Uncharacterized protein n=1 Tax=Triparma strigata TaxID=1606541 RepID=A0A9W7BZE4_9STRA|nr:hypothetical protein TrST_g3150 [Triparma strigata]